MEMRVQAGSARKATAWGGKARMNSKMARSTRATSAVARSTGMARWGTRTEIDTRASGARGSATARASSPHPGARRIEGSGRKTFLRAGGNISEYHGHWEAGKRVGFGRMEMAQGDAYEGVWKDNEWDPSQGQPTYFQIDGKRKEL
ncbi:hypothetical protein T484DRAFT_1894551 [Baffinella frigidus]|nr:hypothetical protein T484DRAFT_1894551 [Cryptophyta sp. CCMP2293]